MEFISVESEIASNVPLSSASLYFGGFVCFGSFVSVVSVNPVDAESVEFESERIS